MSFKEQLRKPRTWFIAVPVVILLAVVVGPFVYFNVIQDDAPARASLDDLTTPTTDDGATTETTDGSGDTTAPSDSATIDGSWEVADGTGSFAGYRATEVLFGQSNEAAGRTEEVTGTLEIDGTTVTAATVEVDLTGLSSDEDIRDGQVQNRILETGEFPTATFELTEPIDFGTEPDDQEEITVEATGDLTVHGETQTVTVELAARKNGEAVEVSGSIPVTWSDFSINDPSGGPAQVEGSGEIEFALSFAQA